MPGEAEDAGVKTLLVKAHGRKVSFNIDAPSDYIQASILRTKRFYESDLLDEVFHRTLPGMRFVDVGANIGNHTVFFSGIAGMDGTAIEPFAPNYQRLKKNLKVNGLKSKVQCLNIALGRKPGQAKLISIKETNTGTAAFTETEKGDVEVRTLDDLELDRFHFLKIDVEGMELEVLKAAGKALREYAPLVICEAQTDKHFAAIRSLMEGYGYRPTRRYCYTPTYFFEPTSGAA